MIDINELRFMNRPENIAITEHARIRLFERSITISDVMNCIDGGEITGSRMMDILEFQAYIQFEGV